MYKIPELTVTISEPNFSHIANGELSVDFRDIKDYYTSRFLKAGLLDDDGRPFPDNKAMVTFKRSFCSEQFRKVCQLSIQLNKSDGKQYYCLHVLEDDPELFGNIEQLDDTDAIADRVADAFRMPSVPDNIRQDFIDSITKEDSDREYYLSVAADLKEYLDKFLSPHKCKDIYEREDRYSEYGFEKARKKLQELYDIAIR